MARDSRDEIAGSDLPPRGQGVTADNTKQSRGQSKAPTTVTVTDAKRPGGYKGSHRERN